MRNPKEPKHPLTAAGHTVHTIANGLEALDLVRRQLFDPPASSGLRSRIDLALIDLWLPGLNGLELVHCLQEDDSALPLVLMTARPAAETAILALRLGVRDYLPKPLDVKQVRATVERLLAGECPAEEERQRRAEQLAQARSWLAEVERVWAGLTEQERAVLRLLAQGQGNRQIAQLLAVSENTIEKHVGNLLGKLGVTSRVEAAVWAARAGVLQKAQELGNYTGGCSRRAPDF